MNLETMLKERSDSVVSTIFSEVPDFKPELPPPPEPLPTLSADGLTVEQPDPEPEYIPLTKGEIKAKSKVKAMRLAQIIVIVSLLIKTLKAYAELKKGDIKLIERHEEMRRANGGKEPVYKSNHPIHAARERYAEFERILEEGEHSAQITDEELEMLSKAYEAQLDAQNRRKESKAMSVSEVALDIAWMRMYGEFNDLALKLVGVIMKRLMR